ncbi:MAG: hypothetical protein A3H17_03955 [Candidatus Levybacteria bacterium RIFCSPLOWO2_12_FULL_37_14]|nr:MAG: hypothetical protein A3H17_03955 [Candidatus Levybacteria bacterium RIFCSPLOWO2_12_FULL_37_14]
MKEDKNLTPSSAEGRRQFNKVRNYYLQPLNEQGLLPRDGNGILHVLSVGCGFSAHEAVPLQKLGNVQYKGIDISPRRISSAECSNLDVDPECFQVEDARKIVSKERNRYGLIVMKNPQVLDDPEDDLGEKSWFQIFKSSCKKLSPNGYIFVSVDDPLYERAYAKTYLERLGVKIVIDEKTRALPSDNLSTEDYWIILGKKEN